ncbi:MAG: peptide deformylase [Candidatus Omnitrophica bacterium CG_4_9_14_0_2_um_filter_42_8]|nr:MAG: peptide deformylase [Candidatus Omnitrophica bacterium CG22_combo_CG10-13_8_21_14_all_43_16]PJC47035.1 MAG: peptide deformylase [Candidatus Omnitrophica bacterium CG_4_9_14_0_2_um_filter_42_8]
MAKLEIKIYPDPALRKKARLVGKAGDDERRLAYNMIETMRASNGVGLAAPQVGISKRIIVVEDVEGDNSAALTLVNPKITRKKGKAKFCEGCLSLPGISNDVVRPEFITVEALNLDGDELEINTGGILARILQHEIDHLDGIVFIDKIGFLKRKKIIKQLGAKVCMEL